VPTAGITSGVVDVRVVDRETDGTVDAEDLDWGVLDADVVDEGFALQAVGIEELGLGLAAVRALPVPPTTSVAIEDRARRTSDRDVSAADGDQWASPLFVAESRSAFEDAIA